MLLFLLGIFIFLSVSGYFLLFKHSLYPLRWLVRLTAFILTADRKLSSILATTLFIHFLANLRLGVVRYNSSNLDILTHFLFGFLAREIISIADRFYPFIAKLRERMPGITKQFISPSTLALALTLEQGLQEEIQKRLPLLASAVSTTLPDQIKDFFTDILGIALSAHKGKPAYLFKRSAS